MRTALQLSCLPFFAAALLATASPASSQCVGTSVSGTIFNQVWSPAGSPYCVAGDLRLIQVTILPGTTVQVDGDYAIEVVSTVSAVGSQASPITFTSTTGDWNGVSITGGTSDSILAWCVIENADSPGLTIVDSLPRIEDCVIQNNTAGIAGAGVRAQIANGSLALKRCTITGNRSTTNGGGLFVDMDGGNYFMLEQCTVSANQANHQPRDGNFSGGGIWFKPRNGSLYLSNSLVADNLVYSRCSNWCCKVSAYGGGLHSAGGDVYLSGTSFERNTTRALDNAQGGCEDNYGYGGGIYFSGAGSTLTALNSIFACNNSYHGGTDPRGYGAAVYMASGTASLVNTTLFGNGSSTGRDVPALNAAGSATFDVRNSILWKNNLQGTTPQTWGRSLPSSAAYTVNFSNVQGGFAAGTGILDQDPLFFSEDCANLDLDLIPISPCVNFGDPAPAFDDGCDRASLAGTPNDMGASGGPQNCPFATPALVGTRTQGLNPMSLTGSKALLGQSFSATVDLSTTGHPFAVLEGHTAPLDFTLASGYAVLVNIGTPFAPRPMGPIAGPQATFTFNIPSTTALLGCAVYLQAAHAGGGTPFALSNSLDLVIGTF